jgi:hypothetical protein
MMAHQLNEFDKLTNNAFANSNANSNISNAQSNIPTYELYDYDKNGLQVVFYGTKTDIRSILDSLEIVPPEKMKYLNDVNKYVKLTSNGFVDSVNGWRVQKYNNQIIVYDAVNKKQYTKFIVFFTDNFSKDIYLLKIGNNDFYQTIKKKFTNGIYDFDNMKMINAIISYFEKCCPDMVFNKKYILNKKFYDIKNNNDDTYTLCIHYLCAVPNMSVILNNNFFETFKIDEIKKINTNNINKLSVVKTAHNTNVYVLNDDIKVIKYIF